MWSREIDVEYLDCVINKTCVVRGYENVVIVDNYWMVADETTELEVEGVESTEEEDESDESTEEEEEMEESTEEEEEEGEDNDYGRIGKIREEEDGGNEEDGEDDEIDNGGDEVAVDGEKEGGEDKLGEDKEKGAPRGDGWRLEREDAEPKMKRRKKSGI